jgi:4-carboxymuconolactone decarboxylase
VDGTLAMTPTVAAWPIVPALDEPTTRLVRLAGAIAGGSEADVRANATACTQDVSPEWVEEVILQSYLFAGLPRTLNAMREWRRLSGRAAPASDDGTDAEARSAEWRARGEATCAAVYGHMYDRLRVNIAALHPALDAWMVVEGYGKVLGRPQLDLMRRELCIVAMCAVAKQDRQLQSHLHGALNVGATPEQVAGAITAVSEMAGKTGIARALAMLKRVLGK